MPSDLSSWLIAVPMDSDSDNVAQDLQTKLEERTHTLPRGSVSQLVLPTLKTGTLDGLISLSEELPKHDTFFTGAVAKIVETLRNLLNNDPARLAQHTLVNEKSCDDYLFRGWRWNTAKYAPQRGLKEIVDGLNKEMTLIDTVSKAKLNSYNLAKGSLVQMQRKKTGNLSVRALADIVSKADVIHDSEFMETLFVAVPKNLVREWWLRYERLASMVVPRSASTIAQDEDYTLFSVAVFKRVRDEFAQKCRENKFILREFTYSDDLVERQRAELEAANASEKELWTELMRVSRTNFSEAFQVLVHLKVIRLFVESVLRYGLPANYVGVVVKPDPKTTKKLLTVLTQQFAYLGVRTRKPARGGAADAGNTEYGAEYQQLLEEEMFDFVLFEVPWIVS